MAEVIVKSPFIQRSFLNGVGMHATWSQSRSCPWFHYVCWTDDRTLAEPDRPPMGHKDTQQDGK